MIVQPRTWSYVDDQSPKVIGSNGMGIWIECEGIRPKSFEGKTVTLFMDPEMATRLLKELRSYCIRMRSKPLGEEIESPAT